MDTGELKARIAGFVAKNKFIFLVLAAGLLLMWLPSSEQEPTPREETGVQFTQENLEDRLEQVLAQMEGVGKVRVLLTLQTGEITEYQTDKDQDADGSLRMDTVTVSGENRQQQGLVKTVTPGTYLGAIVVCQGADSPMVRLELVQAVSNATGLGSDRISIVKMK